MIAALNFSIGVTAFGRVRPSAGRKDPPPTNDEHEKRHHIQSYELLRCLLSLFYYYYIIFDMAPLKTAFLRIHEADDLER